MSGVTAPLFHRQCRPSAGVGRKFSAVTFSHRPFTEQAYILLAARLLYSGRHRLARTNPYQWKIYLNNLAWLCGSDFRSGAMNNATKQLDFQLIAWNSRLHLNLSMALFLFVIPVAVFSQSEIRTYSAIGTIGLNPGNQQESYGFLVQNTAEPDWKAALSSLWESSGSPPDKVVYRGDSSNLRTAMNQMWPETILTPPDADDFPSTLCPDPERPIIKSFRKVMSDLEIEVFPDEHSLWEILGSIMADYDAYCPILPGR